MKLHVLVLAVVTLLVVLLFHGTAGPAHAKSASWVISGGALGDYAFRYWPGWEDEAAIPGDAPAIAAPADEPALRYDIYPSWGVFAVAMQLQEGRPAMAYYPEERLLRESRPGGSEAWHALTREGAGLLDEGIAEALRRKAAGELDASPVVADFRARGVHKGQLSFRPSHGIGYSFNVDGSAAEALVLGDLAAIVSQPPAGESRETPRYSIQIWAGTRFEGWGGPLGYYSPPAQGIPGLREGLPGRFWIESISLSEPNPYYATTPGFDRIVEEALRAAEAATLAPDEPVASLAEIAAEAGEVAPEPAALAPVDGPNPRGQGAWNWPAALAAGAGFAAGVAALPAARRFRRLRRGS